MIARTRYRIVTHQDPTELEFLSIYDTYWWSYRKQDQLIKSRCTAELLPSRGYKATNYRAEGE